MRLQSVLLLLISCLSDGQDLKSCKEKEKCDRLLWNPSFDPALVLEYRWSVCYTWKTDYRNHCIQVQFKNATPEVTKRIWSDMEEYLEHHPPWEAAVLKMKSNVPEEMLLFVDEGPVGKLTAINNVVRSNQMVPAHKSIPLFHFAFKFLKNGKYLVKLNCKSGAAELMVRDSEVLDKKEIEEVALTLNFAYTGYHSCTKKYWIPSKGTKLIENQTASIN